MGRRAYCSLNCSLGPTTDPHGITCAFANSSDSDEVGKSYECYPDCDKKNGVGNEIREDHED
jgi:hypothetical protein